MSEPKELHRYLNFVGGKITLSEKKLKFSRLDQYNDPFEFVPAASSELFRFAPNELQSKLNEYIQTEEGKKKLKEVEDNIGWGDIAKGGVFAAGMIVSPVITSIIGAGLLLFNNDDEQDNIFLYAQKYLPLFLSVRCCCFSQKADDILMWSHYADQHKGIVITFDPFVGYWLNENFKKIVYSDERLGLPDLKTNTNEYVWQMLTRKAKCWEYEQEYRIVKFGLSDKDFNLPIHPESVKAIRLGVYVEKTEREEIIDLRNQFYPNAVIYQAKLNTRKFGLDFEELQ